MGALIRPVRPETDERELFLGLIRAGEALKEEAVWAPDAPEGSLGQSRTNGRRAWQKSFPG